MHDRLMKKAAVWGALFFLVAMIIMIYGITLRYSSVTKLSESDKIGIGAGKAFADNEDVALIPLENDPTNQYFCVPVSVNVTEDGFLVKNNYLDKKLLIEIKGQDAEFYKNNKLFGNSTHISKITSNYETDKVILEFELKDYFECDVIFKNNILYLTFIKPKEKYDKIVFVDIDKNNTKRDVLLELSERLKKRFDNTDIHIYFSRVDSSTPDDEKVIQFSNTIGSDLLISVRIKEVKSEMDSGIECFYNPDYFIPFLGNVELADLLQRNITQMTQENSNGLRQPEADDVLLNKSICPTAAFVIENTDERLKNEAGWTQEYLDQLAEGISISIEESFELIEEVR